ncbi:hypothetical protein [Fischerella thermalis]|uniref:hypothetical protein n=1 Tax=Fischerella thermalis TaxID=372787 RepID=UPI0011AF1AD6|nr:hypothetical protein [Fischerella thermalis]
MKIRDRGLSYQQTHDPSVSISLHCGRFFMLSLWAIAPGVLVLVCKRKGKVARCGGLPRCSDCRRAEFG